MRLVLWPCLALLARQISRSLMKWVNYHIYQINDDGYILERLSRGISVCIRGYALH